MDCVDPIFVFPDPPEPRARRYDRVIEPGEVVDPLNRRTPSPQHLCQEVVPLAERFRLRGFRAAGMLCLVEGRCDERLRSEERLEVDDPQETAPSHGYRHGSRGEKGVGPEARAFHQVGDVHRR